MKTHIPIERPGFYPLGFEGFVDLASIAAWVQDEAAHPSLLPIDPPLRIKGEF